MLGHRGAVGIMRLTLQHLFDCCPEAMRIVASFVELYNEEIRDLLGHGESLELREDPRKGPTIAGAMEVPVSDVETVMKLVANGNERRTQESTRANPDSSRSHAVLQISLTPERGAGTRKLSMIDLAGSERAAETQNRGIRLTEGARINQSLLALGNVINALHAKNQQNDNKFVNFRDSKLTRLLKDSLGGNCRTLMIAHVSPAKSSFEETLNTLKYASRARAFKNSFHDNIVRRVNNPPEKFEESTSSSRKKQRSQRPRKRDGASSQRGRKPPEQCSATRNRVVGRIQEALQLRKSVQQYGRRRSEHRLEPLAYASHVLLGLTCPEEASPKRLTDDDEHLTMLLEQDAAIRQRTERECHGLSDSVRRHLDRHEDLFRTHLEESTQPAVRAKLAELLEAKKTDEAALVDAEMAIVGLELARIEKLEARRRQRDGGRFRVHEVALEKLDVHLRLRNGVVRRLVKELEARGPRADDDILFPSPRSSSASRPATAESPRSPRHDDPNDILADILADPKLRTAVDRLMTKASSKTTTATPANNVKKRPSYLPPVHPPGRRHLHRGVSEPVRWRR